jgi:hypothetical protein
MRLYRMTVYKTLEFRKQMVYKGVRSSPGSRPVGDAKQSNCLILPSGILPQRLRPL